MAACVLGAGWLGLPCCSWQHCRSPVGGAAGNSDPPPTIASITVTSPVPSIAVNGSVQFSASVQNSADGVLWQVNAVSGGNNAVGTISPSGLYTAPAIVPS